MQYMQSTCLQCTILCTLLAYYQSYFLSLAAPILMYLHANRCATSFYSFCPITVIFILSLFNNKFIHLLGSYFCKHSVKLLGLTIVLISIYFHEYNVFYSSLSQYAYLQSDITINTLLPMCLPACLPSHQPPQVNSRIHSYVLFCLLMPY